MRPNPLGLLPRPCGPARRHGDRAKRAGSDLGLLRRGPTVLTFSFSTASPCASPAFKIGPSPSSLSPSPVFADAPFHFTNAAGLAYYYRARVSGLLPGTRYFYAVQACGAWSPTLSTTTLPPATDFKVLVWGDMGRDGGEQILPALIQEAEAAVAGAAGAASFSVIAGDFGYDLHDEEGGRGARFMSRLSNVSASLPMLVRAPPPPLTASCARLSNRSKGNFTPFLFSLSLPPSFLTRCRPQSVITSSQRAMPPITRTSLARACRAQLTGTGTASTRGSFTGYFFPLKYITWSPFPSPSPMAPFSPFLPPHKRLGSKRT